MPIPEQLNLLEAAYKVMLHEIIAGFTRPINIGTTPQSMLWLFPLAIAGVIVYKAMKLPKITLGFFLKEVAALFLFLIGLLIIITLALFAIVVIVTE